MSQGNTNFIRTEKPVRQEKSKKHKEEKKMWKRTDKRNFKGEENV